MKQTYQVDANGFFGRFGGTYVEEALKPAIEQLRAQYLDIINSEKFRKEYMLLLQDYVGRPSPLYLSPTLSAENGCKVYLKREDLNHTGAHKINNAIGQVLMAKYMGKKRIIAETGAGQHGVATATVCALMQIPCVIYMGAEDVKRQRPNVEKMEMLGAEIRAVETGGAILQDAIDEALKDWSEHPDETHYLIGSAVGPHPYPDLVARLQSVISEEIREQMMQKEGRENPDYLIACVGGGSNSAGTVYHFLDDEHVRIVLAEAGGKGVSTGLSAATMHVGVESVLHGARTLVMLTPEGEVAEPYSISAGLDYPGVGPLQAHLSVTGRAQVLPITDDEAMRAAYALTRGEGILPAIESAHALAALKHLKFEPTDVVVVTLSGRGDKDIDTYLRLKDQYCPL